MSEWVNDRTLSPLSLSLIHCASAIYELQMTCFVWNKFGFRQHNWPDTSPNKTVQGITPPPHLPPQPRSNIPTTTHPPNSLDVETGYCVQMLCFWQQQWNPLYFDVVPTKQIPEMIKLYKGRDDSRSRIPFHKQLELYILSNQNLSN